MDKKKYFVNKPQFEQRVFVSKCGQKVVVKNIETYIYSKRFWEMVLANQNGSDNQDKIKLVERESKAGVQ